MSGRSYRKVRVYATLEHDDGQAGETHTGTNQYMKMGKKYNIEM